MKSKNGSINVLGIITILLIILATALSLYFILKNNNNSSSGEPKEIVKSSKISNFVDALDQNELVEESDLDKYVTSILLNKDGLFESHLFNYVTGSDITIYDLIKEDKVTDFDKKINELINLKYPKFIASVLETKNGNNVYHFKETELIIYFYNYDITPSVDNLSLKVNYNEIKDYLKMNVTLSEVYENEDGSVIDPNKKHISITFDDGPSTYTKELVDILDDNKVNVTFFMVTNRLDAMKDTVLYVHAHGNEIGYHSYNHTSMKVQSIKTIQEQFKSGNELIESIIGEDFKLTRPPYGAINNNIRDAIDTAWIKWSIDTNDWRYKDVDYLYNHVITHAKDGEIVLFHDMYPTSIEAVKKVLPKLYADGYQVVTVSKLAELHDTKILNNNIYFYFK